MRRARKRLGQHFLHDPIVVGKIVAAIDPKRGDRLVEIGGGRGALTAPLLERSDELHVIELDNDLADLLEERYGDSAALTVHRGDALKFDYSRFAADGAALRVVGNLPYNVSTPLLFRLLDFRSNILDMHLMLQKEVVDRMTAQPGGKDYGRLTVMLAAWTDIEACFDIGPGAFTPPPKVRSTFVRIRPLRTPSFTVRDESAFAELVARLFSMRRKTLARSLKGRFTARQIEAAGIEPGARPETLRPADFARLAELEIAP